MRGGFLNKAHADLDLSDADDLKEYWDFTQEEFGKEDITAAISKIVSIRSLESRACMKT